MESILYRRPEVIIMANKSNATGTSVSAPEMDPESRRLFVVRKVLKGKKPQFKRAACHKFKRLDDNWRRPRGTQGKQRRKYKAKGALAQVG
jgi:large subunit ribosomal protein L32e